jgi:hypothetical protein
LVGGLVNADSVYDLTGEVFMSEVDAMINHRNGAQWCGQW